MDIIDALIELLTGLKTASPGEFWLKVGTAAAAVVVPALTAYRIAANRARRHFKNRLDEYDALKAQLGAAEEKVREQRDEIRAAERRREAEVAALEARLPEGFLARIAVEARDDNFEREVGEAERFVAGQREALHRAFETLARAHTGYGAAEAKAAPLAAAASYEMAARWAEAGLAVEPEDRRLRLLAEDLSAAAAQAGEGQQAVPRGEAERAETLRAADRLPDDADALIRAFFAARDAGRFALMTAIAEHGERLARRTAGPGSRLELRFGMLRAEGEWLSGSAAAALDRLTRLLPPMRRLFTGDELRVTLYARYLIAACRRDLGQPAEALAELEALLPEREKARGAGHPDTLATRYEIAACRHDLGQPAEALAELEALLPEEEKALGVGHPQALDTRSLMADCLLDLGRPDEARTVHDGVLARLLAAGLGEGAGEVERARAVEARLGG